MTLFRKYFHRKPPERLVEVAERVYVLDCCFSTNFVGDDKYRGHVESAVTKMRDHWPDASFAVFSFLRRENHSQIVDLLSKHSIKVVEYHTQNGNHSLLAFEMVHDFLIASESWLDHKESNVLLLHCERGCWPVLAFMLAALLIYRKHCVGEQRTLDMIYKYATPELLQLVSEINPVPSQLRYLQYVSERILYSEWLPQVRSLVLHCIVLRGVPSMNQAEGGFRPIFRIYGLKYVGEADQIPRMIYSTPKESHTIRHYKQADYDLTKIEINCQIKGDVMIECTTLDEDRQLEETMFRITFNTSFVKSNLLVLSHDEVDTPWNVMDQFSRDFKAEMLFSEMCSSDIQNHFCKDVNDGVQRKMLNRQDNFGREPEVGMKENKEQGEVWSESPVLNAQKTNTYTEEPLTALSRPVESKILSPRIHTVSSPHSFQESLLRYPNGHSPLGITALLQDTSSNTNMVTISPRSSLSPCSVLLRSSICNLSASRQENGHSEAASFPAASPSPRSEMSSSLTSKDSAHHPPPQPVLSKAAKSMQSINSVSDSKDTLESSSSVPLLAASSSTHSPSLSSASPITTETPFCEAASSSSKVSLAKPEKKKENATDSQQSNASGSISCHLPEKSCETVTRPPPPPPSCPPKQPLSRMPPPPSCPPKQPLSRMPPPPPGAKFRMHSVPKKSSLKPYHWLKLTLVKKGSLWAEIQEPEEAAEAPEFDMSELESLFPANVPMLERGDTKSMSKGKSAKVNLVDFKRAYNCEIMLTKIKIPLADIMNSVLSFDASTLDADQVDRMIQFCPTTKEMEILKNYNGDKENLGNCEQMMKVPRASSKLEVFSFRIQFDSMVCDLRGVLNLVNSACEEVRNSIKLKRVMQSILSLGNVLNHGTVRGSAIGFRLDSLPKLRDTRAKNNKTTLLHYLCKVLAEKLPELIDFPKDVMSLEAVNKIQLKPLKAEMDAIINKLNIVKKELQESENDGPVSGNFCKMLKAFIQSAEAEVRSLKSLEAEAGKNAEDLVRYFNEDPLRYHFEEVVSTLLNFVRMFMEAHEENCKNLEKDAVNEKVKPTALAGELDKRKPTTNACN